MIPYLASLSPYNPQPPPQKKKKQSPTSLFVKAV